MYSHSLSSRSSFSLFFFAPYWQSLPPLTNGVPSLLHGDGSRAGQGELSLVHPRSRSQPQCIVDSFTMASDPVDIKLDLEKECLATECAKKVQAYNACLERIKSVDPMKEPHCYNQYFDIIHCVDVCVDPKLWPTLK
ncbi:hypothetical protein LSCM4_03365 [Leishmania orientalis]|uniref:Ubiquinol-cytochrome C reductase hinge domain-containing protein n=1 Tax=Leishmania orientalis TaxID=2249476 RepID=A0A836GTY9_9TRYP|nr:hypothetical protein LSCM4_03365 [Leishmania orientalis]